MARSKVGSLVRMKADGAVCQLGMIIKGIRDGWTYFVHYEDGRCAMVKRIDFDYLTKKAAEKTGYTYRGAPE